MGGGKKMKKITKTLTSAASVVILTAGLIGSSGLLTADAAQAASASKIEAGSYHSGVLLDDGTISTSGKNAYGQLGDGTQIARYNSKVVSGFTGKYLTDIIEGGNTGFAIDSAGSLYS